MVEGSDPGGTATQGKVYVKDVSAIAELFFQDDTGQVVQLTTNGAVNAAGAAGDGATSLAVVAYADPVIITTYTVVGALEFDPSAWSATGRTITLVLELQTSNAGFSCDFRLFNRTDNASVVATEVSSVSINPEKSTVTITVPTDFPNSNKAYEAQIKMGTASASESVRCLNAHLLLEWS
jgi:hypothetical protein